MSRIMLSRAALDHILDTYANHGGDAARALAPSYGVQPSYVKKLACMHGVKVKFRYARQQARRRPDPRWQWAVQRGAVVA